MSSVPIESQSSASDEWRCFLISIYTLPKMTRASRAGISLWGLILRPIRQVRWRSSYRHAACSARKDVDEIHTLPSL